MAPVALHKTGVPVTMCTNDIHFSDTFAATVINYSQTVRCSLVPLPVIGLLWETDERKNINKLVFQ